MVKVAVLGAAGGIGQPLSLLLATSASVRELALYDIVNTPGVAADLGHMNTGVKVAGFLPPNNGLEKTLTGTQVVVIPAGVPRKPGMTRDDLFKINAGIVRDLALGIAKYCPDAFICVISNPVNSTVPIVAQVLKNQGVFNPKKLFGVTTLDAVRASTFLSQVNGSFAPSTRIPVYGGHSGHTIVPILSRVNHQLGQEELEKLTNRIQFGGDEVVQAKDGTGSATLSMAFAAKRFVDAILRAINGEQVVEASYVALDENTVGAAAVKEKVQLEFFAAEVALGPEGIKQVHPLGDLSEYEQGLLSKALPELKGSIAKGVEFVATAKL